MDLERILYYDDSDAGRDFLLLFRIYRKWELMKKMIQF